MTIAKPASAHTDRFVIDHLPPPDQWPDLVFDTPELQFPDRLNATAALLDQAIADGDGPRMCIIGEHVQWTYQDLQHQVNRLANLLVRVHGVQPGNRVLLRGTNSPWLAACWLAVWKAGAVAVGTMPLLRAKELKQIIHLAQASHALCEAALAAELQACREECPELTHLQCFDCAEFDQALSQQSEQFTALDTAADDPALIAFTSGTTGVPKGCVHFHRDVLAMCEVFPRHCLKPTRDDRFVGTPPLAFTFGLGGLLCFPLAVRASTVLLPKLPPPALLQAIEQHQASICVTSPTAYRQMTALVKGHRLTSLHKCVSAGEVLPVATREQWRAATGLQIYDGIGGTELIHIYIASSPETYRHGALGQVLPGYQARLVDQEGKAVAVGEEGWLLVKGPTGCRYLNDARQARYVRDGWNITGDTYHQDADGYFYYHSRVDDIIVTSGYNVASPEVESVLLEHPAVAECGVIGVPDPERGQILKAFVVLKPGFAGNDDLIRTLQDFVKNNAAPYKYPRAISFLTALPRTETGKLQRFRLKEFQ